MYIPLAVPRELCPARPTNPVASPPTDDWGRAPGWNSVMEWSEWSIVEWSGLVWCGVGCGVVK